MLCPGILLGHFEVNAQGATCSIIASQLHVHKLKLHVWATFSPFLFSALTAPNVIGGGGGGGGSGRFGGEQFHACPNIIEKLHASLDTAQIVSNSIRMR
jgi:hypothetical protein